MTVLMNDQTQDAAPESENPRKKSRLGQAATYAMLLASAAVLIVTVVIPMLIGGKSGVVMSGSMSPNIPVGNVIVTQPVDADSLHVGDVITYMPDNNISNGMPIVHRIRNVLRGEGHIVALITMGDANTNADAPITPDMITGKVAYTVPFVGYPRYWIKQVFSGGK